MIPGTTDIASNPSPVALPLEACLHLRTLQSIIGSCVVTIFLCTWVAYHPNVPEHSKGSRGIKLLKRLGYMILALLSPEAVLVTAFSNLECSRRRLQDLMRKHPACGWTRKHALFAYMGGFRLIREDGSEALLYNDAFFEGVINGEFEMPTITEEEIEDRSKHDGIGKAFTIIHTLWFAQQVVVRATKRLPVTELELTTLAHVVFNVFIYLCWWYKPKDVNVPVKVHPPRSNRRGSRERLSHGEGEGSRKASGAQAPAERKSTLNSLPEQRRPEVDDLKLSCLNIMLMLLLSIVGGLFGAIHCLAWNSPFPTRTETILWRTSALIVTNGSGTLALTFIMLSIIEKYSGCLLGKVYFRLAFFISVISSCARVALLLIAFLALRALPEKAYVTPPWTVYMPHVG